MLSKTPRSLVGLSLGFVAQARVGPALGRAATATALTVLAACAAYDDALQDDELAEGEPGPDPDARAAESGEPSYEAFRAASEVWRHGDLRYVVEEDIVLASEDELRAYYEEYVLHRHRRSIINLVGGQRDVREDPLDIRYCLTSGWGSTQYDTDGDGVLDATAPSKSSVVNALAAAAPAWSGAARVRLVYVPALDGPGCTTNGPNPGVDFVVQHYGNPRVATGPRPSLPWEDQDLQVPTAGLSTLLAIHEIGHTLGFLHEHTHSGASPRCLEGTPGEELTDYDPSSAMVYRNCPDGTQTIAGNRVSVLDGIGAREVYGNPDWWAGVL